MVHLLDTNIAIRAVLTTGPQCAAIRQALTKLTENGVSLVVSAQVLGETWSLCTRPTESRGGYGLTVTQTDYLIARIVLLARLLPEPPDIWTEQHRLLVACGVSGVAVHDCRIATWCRLSGVDHILTLHGKDFGRYGVATVDPHDV